MPFNFRLPFIGAIHVRGHTGRFIDSPKGKKAAAPQLEALKRISPSFVPREKPAALLPRIEIGKVTPFTRLLNQAQLDDAIRELPQFDSHEDIFRGVTEHLDSELPRLRAEPGRDRLPTMIVISEEHRQQSSVTALIAALAHQPRRGGAPRGVLLREIQDDSDSCARFTEHIKAAWSQWRFARGRSNGQNVVGRVGPAMARGIAKTQLGMTQGYHVRPFDLGRHASDRDARENQMIEAIAKQLATHPQGPIIVSTGNVHLGPIMEAFKEQANVVGVSSVIPAAGGPPLDTVPSCDVSRVSYNLSAPSAYAFRSTFRLETRPFRYALFAQHKGIDVAGHRDQAAGTPKRRPTGLLPPAHRLMRVARSA
jgi:hypothetical protein